MIGSFTGLAIFISCLGLWVLVMFSCSTRTKEMGIRKVLGASRWNLFYQLVKGFFLLILIAVVIALPVALVQYERLVESLCFPDGFRSLVLYCARIVDVVHFIRDGGLSDNENNNEQTCSFVKI